MFSDYQPDWVREHEGHIFFAIIAILTLMTAPIIFWLGALVYALMKFFVDFNGSLPKSDPGY